MTREIRLAGADDVDRAVAAARAAHPAWRAMPGDKRRDLMLRLASVIEERAAEMSPLLSAENGSILLAGPHMSADAAQKFRYFGGWADKLEGRTVPTWGGPAHDYVSYEPFGTIGIIVPWNGPFFAATMVMARRLRPGTAWC
ncbi:aldehyde dehydrogenase family protein [Novosphingobium resinovorum]